MSTKHDAIVSATGRARQLSQGASTFSPVRGTKIAGAVGVASGVKRASGTRKPQPVRKPQVARKTVPAPADDPLAMVARTQRVADSLGSKRLLAELLGVSASQPTRWTRGEESPSVDNTRAIIDLEHVVTRAGLLWGDAAVVRAWLQGSNAFLDGARPIDVFVLQGSALVIEALDQESSGAFA